MSRDERCTCPPWCVADHADEDDLGTPRHRGPTVVVPGIAIESGEHRSLQAIEILIELHADHGDPVVGLYVGDGQRAGMDITIETADRMVRRIVETLEQARAPTIRG